MEHDLEVIDLGRDKRYRRRLCARCTCGHLTPVVDSPETNDDEITAHQREARRLRLGLGVRSPTLKTSLKHYEYMAGHPACTIPEREAWIRLVDETRQRIEQTTVDNTVGQDSLLDLLEESP